MDGYLDRPRIVIVAIALAVTPGCGDTGLSLGEEAPELTVQMVPTGVEATVVLEIWAEWDDSLSVTVRSDQGDVEQGVLRPADESAGTPSTISNPSLAVVERLPIEYFLVDVGDGRVQAEPGHLVVAAYRGPDDRTVRETARVPEVPLVEGERLPRSIVETLHRNTVSGIGNRRRDVLRSESAFRVFWEDALVRDVPPVDFGTSMVLGVTMGGRPSGGYGIGVDSVVYRPGDGYAVFVTESSPGERCFVNACCSSPIHIVRVPRLEGEVTFVEREEVRACS